MVVLIKVVTDVVKMVEEGIWDFNIGARYSLLIIVNFCFCQDSTLAGPFNFGVINTPTCMKTVSEVWIQHPSFLPESVEWCFSS
jgi:hypothetical protein